MGEKNVATEGFTLGVEQHHDDSRDDVPVPSTASNVLLLDDDETACNALLTASEPGDEDVVVVSWDGRVDEHLVRWRAEHEHQPKSVFAVAVGEISRSAAARAGTDDGPSVRTGSTVDVRAVEDPADLTQVGIALTTFLDNRLDGEDRELLVCVDSLTELLAHVPLERAFQFLHVMTVKLSREGAVAHYHLDPDAHDKQTVGTLTQLFDAVLERRDGEWTLRER
ncbi:DUF7504 family protein [Halocalculus aciditolerans]